MSFDLSQDWKRGVVDGVSRRGIDLNDVSPSYHVVRAACRLCGVTDDHRHQLHYCEFRVRGRPEDSATCHSWFEMQSGFPWPLQSSPSLSSFIT